MYHRVDVEGKSKVAPLAGQLEAMAVDYHSQVEVAAKYLLGRGITEATATRFQLGFVGRPDAQNRKYVGRLAIPYLTVSGVSDIRFRCISDHDCKAVSCPKYMSRVGATSKMFNTKALVGEVDTLLICEGEFDAMMAWQVTGLPAVGVPGVSTWASAKHWPRMVKGFDRVVVLCDGDDVGRGLGKQVVGDVSHAEVVSMPEGQDVSDVGFTDPDMLRAMLV